MFRRFQPLAESANTCQHSAYNCRILHYAALGRTIPPKIVGRCTLGAATLTRHFADLGRVTESRAVPKS
eukprot:14316909-Alexandrium_andersonii.AAC.1